jgi:hypothetical protein
MNYSIQKKLLKLLGVMIEGNIIGFPCELLINALGLQFIDKFPFLSVWQLDIFIFKVAPSQGPHFTDLPSNFI